MKRITIDKARGFNTKQDNIRQDKARQGKEGKEMQGKVT
jgi:hypothetical protein